MVSPQCPLGLQAFRTLKKPMSLQHLAAIEEHVAANCPDCPHPPLKDIFFKDDSIKGTTPLLMACHYGELASVKRIVESWGVDVNLAAAYYFDAYYFDRLNFHGLISKIKRHHFLHVFCDGEKKKPLLLLVQFFPPRNLRHFAYLAGRYEKYEFHKYVCPAGKNVFTGQWLMSITFSQSKKTCQKRVSFYFTYYSTMVDRIKKNKKCIQGNEPNFNSVFFKLFLKSSFIREKRRQTSSIFLFSPQSVPILLRLPH